ncbi:MAG: hypothetical protein LUF04_00025 [Bacteroides sp.]|nr:hypothetical protein [Bacteroides sp.]
MTFADPIGLEKEKQQYKDSLLHKPASFYREQSRANFRKLFDLLSGMKSEEELADIELIINPVVKMVTLPFTYEDQQEEEHKKIFYRETMFRSLFLTREELSVYCYLLKQEKDFAETIYKYRNPFTIHGLLQAVRERADEETFHELRKCFFTYTHSLLHEQIFIIC